MKKYYHVVAFIFILITVSCKKNTRVIQNVEIFGKWTLTESLADPGDGSGKWTPVIEPGKSYLQINTDSTMQYSNSFAGRVASDSTMEFYPIGSASKILRYYEVSGDKLTITGGCLEACGSRYIKASL